MGKGNGDKEGKGQQVDGSEETRWQWRKINGI